MSTNSRSLGKYELQQQLGRGSVGEVWKAYDLELRRDVAIKLLYTDLQSDPRFLTRFTTEGATIATLHHSNIVQVHDAAIARSPESQETTAYLAMEYIVGKTLADYINVTSHQAKFPPISQIVYLFTSLSVAIDYAHQQGVIHGNIKPENVLLNSRELSQFQPGEPMLTDFGFPAILGNTTSIGTPHYMSPEQAKGDLPNTRSDIYSLGVVLYEMCTGVKPFRDESSVAIMMQHINTLPTPPTLINPNIPAALSEVILRAMAKDPPTRFSMASLFAAAIADACSIQPILPLPPVRIPEDERTTYPTRSGTHMPILGVSQPPITPFTSGFQHTRTEERANPPASYPVSAPLSLLSGVEDRSPSMPLPTPTNKVALPPITARISATVPPGQPNMLRAQTSGPLMPLPSSPRNAPAQSMAAMPLMSKESSPVPSQVSAPLPRLASPLPPPAATYPPASPQPYPALPTKGRQRSLADAPISIIITSLVLLLAIIGVAIIANLTMSNNKGSATKASATGHIFFQDDALGHEDQLHLEMQNVPLLSNGNSYFAWLQTTNQQSLPLGQLSVQDGNISYLYTGNNQHTNLLSIAQKLLITQESTNSNPKAPGSNVLYQATFNPAAFPYIRNILYATPHFPDNRGVLTGLLETIKSMNDKAGSIVDTMQGNHDYDLSRRQAVRIIEMIDGTSFARKNGDLPANVATLLNTQVGLISSPAQLGYIDTLANQLEQLKQVAGDNTSLLQHIQNVENAITDLRDWVQKIHDYAVKILKAANLTDPAIISVALQLKQVAADSYTGHTIPPNQSPQSTPGSAGANQAYTESQYMATLDIQAA